MAASTSKIPDTNQISASPAKPTRPKRSRKEKGKERVCEAESGDLSERASTAKTVGEGVERTEAGTSASAVDETPWPWVSITDSSASKRPAIFTKDGRCVVIIPGRLRSPKFMLVLAAFIDISSPSWAAQ